MGRCRNEAHCGEYVLFQDSSDQAAYLHRARSPSCANRWLKRITDREINSSFASNIGFEELKAMVRRHCPSFLGLLVNVITTDRQVGSASTNCLACYIGCRLCHPQPPWCTQPEEQLCTPYHGDVSLLYGGIETANKCYEPPVKPR